MAYLPIYFLLLIAMKSEMSITNVQSPEMGLIGYVIEVKAGYQDEYAAFFYDYGSFGLFVAVHILLGGVMRRQHSLRLVYH